jgi:TolA-binding protein
MYRLQLAKMLEDTAKPSMARRYYERVAQDYPNTRAATEATTSLLKLGDAEGQ